MTPARSPRLSRDEGAVLVEFALVLPLITLLLLGVFEYGTAWRETLNLASAVRAASRQAANAGTSRAADYLALQSFDSVMGASKNVVVQKVVVYKTTSANGDPINGGCFTAAAAQSGWFCNIYTGTQVDTIGASYLTHFGPNDTSCTGAWDANWCPITRQDLQSQPPDYVGVWAKVTYTSVTKMLPSTVTFTDRAVARIEPRVT